MVNMTFLHGNMMSESIWSVAFQADTEMPCIFNFLVSNILIYFNLPTNRMNNLLRQLFFSYYLLFRVSYYIQRFLFSPLMLPIGDIMTGKK